MGKKIIRITESELMNVIKRIIKEEQLNEDMSFKRLIPFVMSLMMSYKGFPTGTINKDSMEVSQTMDKLSKIEHDLGNLKYKITQEKPENYEEMTHIIDSIEDMIELKDMSNVSSICDMIESLSDEPIVRQSISAIRDGEISSIRQSLNNLKKTNVEQQDDNTAIALTMVTLIMLSMLLMGAALGSRRHTRRLHSVVKSELEKDIRKKQKNRRIK